MHLKLDVHIEERKGEDSECKKSATQTDLISLLLCKYKATNDNS